MKTTLTLLVLFIFNTSISQTASSDDGLHFATGALISSATYALVYSKTKNKKKAFWYSLGLSSLAGLAKEVYDINIAKGRFDNSEFLATAAGGLTASLAFNIFTGKHKKKAKEKQIAKLNL